MSPTSRARIFLATTLMVLGQPCWAEAQQTSAGRPDISSAADQPHLRDEAKALVQVESTYEHYVRGGGWQALPNGPSLQKGDTGPAVEALRTRLAAEGFVCNGSAVELGLFDATLDCAVRAYQDQRGLDVDGVVGPQTRAALNIPARQRLAQIELNIERVASRRDLPADRVEVNTAAAEAVLFRDDRPALHTRIIVGKPSTPTPSFEAEIRGVVINPPWNVPDSIARGEILPKTIGDPGYLARNHYIWTAGRLVQTPGEHNALGRIKLDMPNPHTVYLHDTPARALFDTARRYYSHGCMRMRHPREIAVALLEDQGWTLEALDAAIEVGETRTIPLPAPVPVYVYYQTAYVREDGALILQPDIYGLDAEALASETADIQIAEVAAGETECAATGSENSSLPG